LGVGFSAEICAQDRFGWNRRLTMMKMVWTAESPDDAETHLRRAKQVGLEAVQPATKEMLQGTWYAQADEFAKDETRVR
jgi:hypothetical protein